jgi:acetoin utilization deacetylase AcuC-like enzyme
MTAPSPRRCGPPPFVHSRGYEVDIGPHVFPIAKYRLVRERLIARGLATDADFAEPRMPSREELLRVHEAAYLEDLFGLRATWRTASSELPLSRAIADAFTLAAGGTLLAARHAIEAGAALHIGGGLHHAFADHAEGFCYVNDVAVAARALLAEGCVARAAVIDCDVHQGNGTARIFAEDPAVFTFSIHQENNYPVKERSDRDVGLEDGVGDDEYLARLEREVPQILERHRPDVVFYLAGADPFAQDQLGGLELSMDGLRERDRRVLAWCRGRGIAVCVALAGGYAQFERDTVAIHAATAEETLRALGRLPEGGRGGAP